MWHHLKSLWGGRAVPDPDADAQGEPITAPEPTPPVDPAVRSPFGRALAAADHALDAGDVAAALAQTRSLLDEAPGEPRVLARTARALALAGEEALAELFDRAAETEEPAPLVELAAELLEAGDARAAVAVAQGARQRGGIGDPDGAIVLSEALARLGDHAGVVETLAVWEGRWVGPGMLQRYALSCVLAGESARWERVAAEIDAIEGAGWIAQAAGRAVRHGRSAHPPDGALRHCVFVEYGAVLLEGRPLPPGTELDAAGLGTLVQRAGEVLAAVDVGPTRVGYGSPRGEVVARWLAGLMGSVASPLSGRIPGKPWVLVAVDDEEALALVEAPEFDHAPTLLFQVIKDPEAAGTPMADVVGVMGAEVRLPMEALTGGGPSRRVPPSLLVSQLQQRAAAAAKEDDGLEALVVWARERASDLNASAPPSLDTRLAYLGDTPAWAWGD